MKTLSICGIYDNLTSAIAHADIDLSYNEPLAREDIRGLERGDAGRGVAPVTQVYVVDVGPFKFEVYYVFDAGKHGVLLNKYEPFHACLHDGAFSLAAVSEDGALINITDPISADRKMMMNAAKVGSTAARPIWLHKA